MKKVIFMLAFTLMSGLVFANNEVVNKTELNNKIEISYVIGLVDVCSFSYALYTYNEVTGERKSFTYSHTTTANSSIECNSYARTHTQFHSMLLESELNR